MNLGDGPAERIYVFGTSEAGECGELFAGATPGEAVASGKITIVTPSNWSKIGFLRAGFPDSMVKVIPHGVDPGSFFKVSPELRSLYRELFGLKPDDFVKLNLGALTPNKGVDLLLQAHASLKQRHKHLKLVVKDQSNLYGITLSDVIADMKKAGQGTSLSDDLLGDVISISDNFDIDGLKALYNACDAYVSPYRAEGFNLPPLEAAACGLPIAVTAGGSTDDYFSSELGIRIESNLIDNGTSMGLEPKLDALINAIECLMQKPADWGGETGSQLVHQKFCWESISLSLLHELGIPTPKS